MNEVIITQQQQVMTSLQISEATGRPHSNVMRDIRNLLEKGVREINFELSSRQQAMPNGGTKKISYYNLTPKGCLILASGYDPVLREKIIDKLEELQCKEKKLDVDASYMAGLKEELRMEGIKRILRQYERESEIHASLAWMQGMRDMMHLGRASVAQMARQEGRRLGLPVPTTLPTGGGGGLLSVTALMRKRGLSGFTASEFNQRMIEAGGMVVRNGRKVLTGWGLDYGENRHSERTPEIVWPVYYEECFSYLCERIGVEFGLPF